MNCARNKNYLLVKTEWFESFELRDIKNDNAVFKHIHTHTYISCLLLWESGGASGPGNNQLFSEPYIICSRKQQRVWSTHTHTNTLACTYKDARHNLVLRTCKNRHQAHVEREREHQQQQQHGANKFANNSQPAQNTHTVKTTHSYKHTHRPKACHARATQANKHTHTHIRTIKAPLPPAASLLSALDCAASRTVEERPAIREATAARGSLGTETTHNVPAVAFNEATTNRIWVVAAIKITKTTATATTAIIIWICRRPHAFDVVWGPS